MVDLFDAESTFRWIHFVQISFMLGAFSFLAVKRCKHSFLEDFFSEKDHVTPHDVQRLLDVLCEGQCSMMDVQDLFVRRGWTVDDLFGILNASCHEVRCLCRLRVDR